MQKVIDNYKLWLGAQLELNAELCRLGIEYSERFGTVSAQTYRKLLTHVGSDLMSGDASRFLQTAGGIANEHWCSALACATEYHRDVLQHLPKP